MSFKAPSSKYDIFLKNPTSYAENSNNFEENANYELYGTFKLDSSLFNAEKL